MKDSEILIKARKLIKAKKENRVCFAINNAGYRYPFQAAKLAKWVSHMLEGPFYEDWVIEHHPAFAKEKGITTFDHREKLREGRIAWLTWMIEYCQAEEAKQ